MKYQMTCPNCHHEWHYDNGYYDDNITRLGIEIQEIVLQLQKHKQLPKKEQYAKTEWWLSAKRALAEKTKQITELKALRKIHDQQVNKMIFVYYREAIKEEFGEQVDKRLLEKAKKEAEAYNISDMMRSQYTRANYKADVISVDKLT